MPEGHSVHRIARQFAHNFAGSTLEVSSPQGRFAEGAAMLDGASLTQACAVGKQMFLAFSNGLWLRVHLGIYGAWDFSGQITTDATIRSSSGRMGQTNHRGTFFEGGDLAAGVHAGVRLNGVAAGALSDAAGEDSITSMGAPRRTRWRIGESEKEDPSGGGEVFPLPPVGAVRVRLLSAIACADLRGPTACEVLTAEEVQAVIDRLGPDPINDDSQLAEDRMVAAVRKKGQPIGQLLMDQAVVSGIGNVYRAELLFRARLSPFVPGKAVPEKTVRELWQDWAKLLRIGIETGQMMTMDGLSGEDYLQAMANRADRHWVYHRNGEPCRVCRTPIALELMATRKLYWCPDCQK